jgi:arylsulfatase A-like enzyme
MVASSAHSLRPRVGAGVLCLVAVAAACQEATAPSRLPEWVELAEQADLLVGESRLPWRSDREVRLEMSGATAWVHYPLLREDWQPAGQFLWRVSPPEVYALQGRLRLEGPDGPVPEIEEGLLEAPGAAYVMREGWLVLGGFAGEAPEAMTLSIELAIPAPGIGERLVQRTFSGAAIALFSGMRAVAHAAVPMDGALTFGTAFEPLIGGVAPGPVLFRILLDGEVVFEHTADTGQGRGCDWHRVVLPPQARDRAELVFEVEGALAATSFLNPVLGPAVVGQPGQRPWKDARPDLVVFLADTFRADNLTAYGGRAEVTPNLDALAADGLCFLQAWSTAAWTLPAHGTLFSGLYPPQAVGEFPTESGLVPEVETIAERLGNAGYRTAAFTDGGFVSSSFGLDQGFEVFAEPTEDTKDLETLLAQAQAFLAADDGRPTFLFVQTYRVHWPYSPSDQTRAELGERLGLDVEAEDLLGQLSDEARALGFDSIASVEDMEAMPPDPSPRLRELYTRLHHLYLGGVADLDRGVGGFVEALQARGLLDEGYLLFTSDHGEAFGEHGALFHSTDPFEEQVRIPLVLVGQGLSAEQRRSPVSLIDVVPTLAELAGLPADPAWPGRSLLHRGPDRHRPDALFAFESSSEPGEMLCVLQDGKKVFRRTNPRPANLISGAFDLARDPHELTDLAETAPWAPLLLEATHATLEQILSTEIEGTALTVDEEKRAELRALGYGE